MPLTLSRMCQAITPSLTLSIDARAKEMKAQGLKVIGFGAGEPDFDTPDYIRDAAKDALDQGMTRYTPAAGTLELRKAICAKLKRDNGVEYTPGQVVVCNGAKHALYTAFQALLNPGDEVLIPAPCWVSYPEMIRMAGGVPVIVQGSEEDDFVVTAQQLAPYVTARTKALMLCSPSNPTGGVWTGGQLAGIAQLAVNEGFYVVADEIYEKLIYDGFEHVSIASLNEAIKAQTILINGVSKSYAMTGWRIGYAAGPKAIIDAMVSHQSHATSAPSTMSQCASVAALEGDDTQMKAMVSAFDQRRQALVTLVNAIPSLSCRMPHGAFYAMMNIKGILGKRHGERVIADSMTFADALLEAKQVAVVPGIAFEAEGYCRLSYAISQQAIQEGLERIAAFVAGLK